MDTFRIHQSRPSFLLVSFFFFLILSSSSAQDDCSPAPLYRGGEEFALNISYPFWTKGHPEYCSHPGEDFQILCNETDKSAEIEIQSRNAMKQTMIIVDKDNFGYHNSNSCLRPSHISLDLNFFQLTIEHLNLTVVCNCSSLVNHHTYFESLDCPSNFTPPSDDFFSIEPLTYIEEQLRGCPIIEIPILEKNCDWLFGNPDHPEASLNYALEEGFDVSWSAVDPYNHCRSCVELANGHCCCDKTSSQPHTCYCNGTRPPHLATCHPAQGHNKAKKKIVIGAAAGVCILLLTCSSFFTICIIRKSSSDNSIFYWKEKSNVEVFLENYGALVPKRYRYSELKKIANYFNDNLGQGGYGSVFKGKLNDGRLVTVKVLNNSKGSNGEDFINEVASIGRTYHVNVVTLLGFCSEGSKRALVYDFMSKGSLEKFIFSDKRGERHFLDSQKLFEIALGIARGLDYLHRGCSTRILHFDIKPHNILLDDNFCPKISDFGLAKLCPQQEGTVSMLDARGTVGYTAPEVFCRNIGGVSHKSDVYSYGMMVLEMIGGRKNIDAKVENTSEVYFPHWVYKHIEVKESLEVLGFGTQAEEEIARKMVVVGLWCIQTNPTNRPSMSRVVEMLEGSLGSLQMPPKPYLSSPSRPCSSTT